MPSESSPSIAPRRSLFASIATLLGIARGPAGRADPRRYNLVLAAVVLPPVLVMLILALTQEPLRGDLTRPGGYAEADYGWRQPQERFSPPLASSRYDRPYDIVILGDSFSANVGGQTDPGAFWSNYLAQRTGLSVAVLALDPPDMTPERLLHHPVFVRSPPKLLILETAERYLLRDYAIEIDARVGRIEQSCRPQSRRLPPFPAFAPLDVAPVPWERDTVPEINIDQAANYFWKAAKRNLFGIDTTRILRLDLTRADLFSSRESNRLLIYDDEIRKALFTTPQTVDAMYCTLIDIQNEVQANGRTRFLFMAAPDKMTTYAEHLADPELRAISLLPGLYGRPSLNQVKLLGRFREAVRCGVKDLYMPNDTHWGSAAHRIIADAVVDTLTGAEGGPPAGCPRDPRSAAAAR